MIKIEVSRVLSAAARRRMGEYWRLLRLARMSEKGIRYAMWLAEQDEMERMERVGSYAKRRAS